ncbi:MAG TPA: PKD domain-containing protein [Niastella sp.]
MLPVNTVFPEFVPDQLLTSDDLNELFGYLDEQGRMTRTNLIGIGIVCGLEVKINAAKNAITITKGTGVTSEGYLITVPPITYTEYNTFDAVKEKYYDKFVNTTTKTQKFNLWEIKQAGVDPDAIDLTESFLADKVVLLFVELLGENNKNCDPNSCDDKGVHVTITFRPLLVTKTDAVSLIGATGSLIVDTYTGLPELKMRRFNVPNTNPVTSAQIFDAYQFILNNTFLTATQNALSQAWTRFLPFVQDEYATNPFTGLATAFAFVNNGAITTQQLQHIQYVYDHFSDLLQAYDEFRKTGTHILSTCCPDSSLFPRHLLLGEAIPLPAGTVSAYRHYFIYSPLFDQREIIAQLKILFKKLVLLKEKFIIPAVSSGSANSNQDPYIRITPSTLGDVGLSQKAIPYYYQVATGPSPLYKNWSPQKTLLGIPQRNLSYNANQYNASDDFVLQPLLFDLEPYNFLRIEGIIGKSYIKVLQNLKTLINQNRLPVDVIALNTDNTNLLQGISTSNASSFSLSGVIDDFDMSDLSCHFQDLEALYEAMKSEILCNLCKELKYYYDLDYGNPPSGAVQAVSKVALFENCSKGYIVKPGTYGYYIEELYRLVGDDDNVTFQLISELLNLQKLVGGNNNDTTTWLGFLVAFFEIPINIIRLAKTFTDDISSFDVDEYCRIQKLLAEKANTVKFSYNIFSSDTGTTKTGATAITRNMLTQSSTGNLLLTIFSLEDLFDHLDVLIYNCKCSAFKALKREYLERVVKLTLLRQFGYFTKQHPGIQHKAGVPMGGTFIIVYHNKPNVITKGKAFGNFVIRGKVVDQEGNGLPSVIGLKGRTQSYKTDADGNFSINHRELPFTVIFKAPLFDDKEVTITSDNPIQVVMGVEEGEEPETAIDNITAGTVIADFYIPYRCCSDCPPIQYVVPELKEPPPANEGPVANAGTDQVITLPVSTVVLNGNGSTDPDGSITMFQWTRLSGPGTPVIVTPNSAQSSVTGLVQGTYEFELTVTDNKGSTARDTMKVTVNPAPRVNQPPVANAGADRTITLSATNPLLLDGSASSDPDGTVQLYNWQRSTGPNMPVIVAPNAAQTPVTGLMAGVYEFQLTVTDNDGATASDSVVITVVLPENKPPVANAGIDQVITLPVNSVTLNGSASTDPDGTITAFTWSLISGPNTPVFGASNAKITQVSGLVQGTYQFDLKVTDDRGDSASDTITVIVNAAREKSCAPLKDIIALFEKLRETDDRFSTFTQMFQSYPQVAAYFKQLVADQVASMPVDKQIDFFASPIGGSTIDQLLIQWLKQLHDMILANTEGLRFLALALYRILMQLAMYIMCIQSEDADKAKVRMDEVLKLIQEHTAAWVALHKQKPFGTNELNMVIQIQADLKAEEARINNNGEATTKPNYLNAIRAIIKILDGM